MAEYGSIYPKEQKCLPFWAKVAIWLAVLAACAAGIAYFFTQGMVDTAREQLDALKNGNFPRAYYEFTSRDFQASTTLDDFQNFIRSQPSLYANKSASFSDRTIQNDLGSLHGTLVADDQTITPIEYQFVKEGGRWKILTMRLVPTGMLASNGPISTRVPESLERPVEQFFSALRDEDVARAYFGSTSKAFQNTTSLKTFREFISQHPELTQYEKLQFGKQTVNPPKGTITLTVSSKNAPLTVECQLVKEDERWKIWNLKVEVPPPSQSVAVVDQDKEAIKQLIDSQLAHLRAGEISRAYYDETSGDFKDTTSLAAFKDYISQYPDLTEEKNFTTGEPEIRGDKATLKGYLGSDPEKGTKIAFQLSREKGLWRIWGFQVEPQPVANEMIPEFSAEELADLIQNQLDAIRSEDISKAYYVYTSSAFRKYTPLNKFEEFVQDHPIFQHNQMINFTNLAFKDGVGSFDGNLVGVDNQSVPVT
ncbi:MAG: DUF4864 domain-containing protein [Chlamydiia bacterium]|nr:DUF4864 domain-containing protein [Chlamydiia bacterium]